MASDTTLTSATVLSNLGGPGRQLLDPVPGNDDVGLQHLRVDTAEVKLAAGR
jgi:hypothetical protein